MEKTEKLEYPKSEDVWVRLGTWFDRLAVLEPFGAAVMIGTLVFGATGSALRGGIGLLIAWVIIRSMVAADFSQVSAGSKTANTGYDKSE